MSRHPAVAELLSFFDYDHLPPHLRAVSRPVAKLARELADALPDSAELTTGLRKLLEGKDCFVRAALRAEPVEAVEPTVFVVFDGPPGPEAGRFVEVEDASGRGLKVGRWSERPDGYWTLAISARGITDALRSAG